jgi:signal transduction histidine kinase
MRLRLPKSGGALWVAIACLVVLVAAAIAVSVVNERALKAQLARDAGAQADLLASAVSGALAFQDQGAAQDYVDAVQVNQNVLAAAVYDNQERLVASFARDGEVIPPVAVRRDRTTLFEGGKLYVVRPVEQAGQTLGTARLRLTDTPAAQRFARYSGMLLILALAALVVGVLAVMQTALRRANAELSRRADDLSATNARLQDEMAERARAEEALQQSQKMEAIGRLTGGVAHDFNNLLMVASSAADLLDRTEDPVRRRKLTEGVRQAVERGAGLTRQLLAFSRRSPLKTAVIDLGAQVEGMRILLERSLREDITVHLDMPPDLWPVEVDVGELELALLNLAVNARDAMPDGGRLTLSGRNCPGDEDLPDEICLTVRDTGTGMPADVAAQVFEPFFTTKQVGKGTGLGLSQVYGFARSSGGRVSVESAEGQGAAFHLCLPRSRKPLTAGRADRPATLARSDGRLLLVEDDDAVAEGVGHMLRDLGYSFVRAANAEEALRILAADDAVDLVFSDMVMPGEMNGLALATEIRNRRPDLPILLTTGFSEAAASAVEHGLDLLPKPYAIQDLAEALQRTAAGHRG